MTAQTASSATKRQAPAALAPTTPWRNRIVGTGEEAPDQLLANPANWRIHPKTQQAALAGALDRVGWVQQVMVNRQTGFVVDGHARVALAISRNEATVPVLYVDLDPTEEALVLATLDPLGTMATADEGKLNELLADVTVDDAGLMRLLQNLGSKRPLLADPDELPDIPGVRERWGRDLLHCPYCHGWEVRDQPIGVLGTLPGSVQHAQLVRQWSDDVVFFAHTYGLTSAERAQLEARAIRVVSGEIARLVVEADRLTGVELTDGRLTARTAVFIRPGNVPHADGLLADLGCEVNEAGFVTVDATGLSSTRGVWAAGDVVDPRAQVITSAGAGSAAAIAINADLVQDDVERAVA